MSPYCVEGVLRSWAWYLFYLFIILFILLFLQVVALIEAFFVTGGVLEF